LQQLLNPSKSKQRWSKDLVSYPDWISGSFVLIRKIDFEDLGGWDERFWMYYEDMDLSRRAMEKGWQRVMCNEFVCIHSHGGSSRINPEVKAITKTENDELDHTLAALRISGRANAVSKVHLEKLCSTWSEHGNICEIISITNAQNFQYWHDQNLYTELEGKNDQGIQLLKKRYKKELIEIVADQCGEIYDENVFTIVFAKRFAGYKRADLFFHDMNRFHKLVSNPERPIQIIWAGKPYPMDYIGIGIFDKIVELCKTYSNCSILVGYELNLSKKLKKGSDAWLTVPRMGHEASGTSGMAAAMNGSVNVGIPDGWFPEFAKDKINCFVQKPADVDLPEHQQDDIDAANLFDLLENEVIPMYYDYPNRWLEIIKNGMADIIPEFDSNRLAKEYYEKLYSENLGLNATELI
jgi:starch phosphorylase